MKNENDIAFEAWFKSHTKGIATTFTHAHWAKKGWDARSEKINRAASTCLCTCSGLDSEHRVVWRIVKNCPIHKDMYA